MPPEPDFDRAKAHRYFSAFCFNSCWELLDKQGRSPAEDADMISRAMASLWHWTQREDCTFQNLSIGYWQASRVFAVLGEADLAGRFGSLCLKASEQEGPFFLGYAHEAARARTAAIAKDVPRMKEHLAKAESLAEQIEEAQDRQQLLADLATIATA